MGSVKSVTKTRYLWRLVSNNWYCSASSSATSSRAFSVRRATNLYSFCQPSGWSRNSHSISASVFLDGFHSALRSRSTSRDVLRAEIVNRDVALFIRFDGVPAVEPRIGAAVNLFHARWHCRTYVPYVVANLFAIRSVAVA